MHRVFRAFLLLIFTAISLPAAPVKVMCWNMQWFPGGSPDSKQAEKKKHMKAAQEAINPDVLCLQEVRDWKAVQELVSVIPNMRVDVVSRFDGDQQQAIASKLPVDSSWACRSVPSIP